MTKVFCTFRQEGLHSWPKAPIGSYLRSLHRHEFHVRVESIVSHNDRDLEFIELKKTASSAFKSLGSPYRPVGIITFGKQSCEQLAQNLGDALNAMGNYENKISAIEVSEDGENGARVEFECV